MRPLSTFHKICCTLAVIVAAAAAAGVVSLLCKPPRPVESVPIQFRDVTSDSGISFVHTDGSSGRRFIVESMSTGIATFDYDGDGLIDVYFSNGAPLPGAESLPRS